MSRNEKITCTVVLTLLIGAVTAFFVLTTKAERRFGVSIPKTSTVDVIGFVYDVRSDLIIKMPEEYFLGLDDGDITYDEVVKKIGKPSGKYGSGIVRAYWRIGERKYAVYNFFGDRPFLSIEEF